MYDGSFDEIMLLPERLDDSVPNKSRVSHISRFATIIVIGIDSELFCCALLVAVLMRWRLICAGKCRVHAHEFQSDR